MLKTLFLKLYVMVFARRCCRKLNTMMYYMSIKGLGVFNYASMKESGEKSFIEKHVCKEAKNKERYVVFDVGGNKGAYTNAICSAIPNAEVFVFEPHPKTFQVLKKNTGNIGRIKYFNVGLSDSNGEMELYDYRGGEGSEHASLNKEVFSTVHESETESYTVKITTIDSVVESEGVSSIDLLKIDVEGNELMVLEGAKKIIEHKQIKIIQFEFTQLNSTTRLFFKDFYSFLSPGYKIYRLLPNDLLEIDRYNATLHEIFGYQNFIAVMKENNS